MELPSLDIWQWSLHQPFAYPVFGYLGALRGLYNLGTSIMEAREVHFVVRYACSVALAPFSFFCHQLDLQVASAPDFTTAFTNATNVVLADPVQPILQMCSLHLVNALWTAAISTFLRRSVGRMINLALLSRTDVNFKLFTMGCILSSIGVVAGLGVALALQYTAT